MGKWLGDFDYYHFKVNSNRANGRSEFFIFFFSCNNLLGLELVGIPTSDHENISISNFDVCFSFVFLIKVLIERKLFVDFPRMKAQNLESTFLGLLLLVFAISLI